jgi:hypothetical protein
MRFHGFIKVPMDGVYTFTLTSDDGSKLRIGGATVIDHDGLHGATPKRGKVHLKEGTYSIEVSYLEAGGAEVLEVDLELPNGKSGPLPASMLFHTSEPADSSGAVTIKSIAQVDGRSVPLKFNVDFSQALDLQGLIPRLSETYTRSFGPILGLIGRDVDSANTTLNVTLKPGLNSPAYTLGHNITISADHLRNDPLDTIGVFIHEYTHVLQDYKGKGREWFTEGSADYTRYKLNPSDRWAKFCRAHISYGNPFGGYWASAAFLMYLEDHYKKPIVSEVSSAVIKGVYQDSIWKKLTGKDLDTLAADYKTSHWKPRK